MVKDEDVYPVGTIVRLRKTGEFARITQYCWLRPELQKYFLNYLAEIEGMVPLGLYAIYHDEVDLEVLP